MALRSPFVFGAPIKPYAFKLLEAILVDSFVSVVLSLVHDPIGQVLVFHAAFWNIAVALHFFACHEMLKHFLPLFFTEIPCKPNGIEMLNAIFSECATVVILALSVHPKAELLPIACFAPFQNVAMPKLLFVLHQKLKLVVPLFDPIWSRLSLFLIGGGMVQLGLGFHHCWCIHFPILSFASTVWQ